MVHPCVGEFFCARFNISFMKGLELTFSHFFSLNLNFMYDLVKDWRCPLHQLNARKPKLYKVKSDMIYVDGGTCILFIFYDSIDEFFTCFQYAIHLCFQFVY